MPSINEYFNQFCRSFLFEDKCETLSLISISLHFNVYGMGAVVTGAILQLLDLQITDTSPKIMWLTHTYCVEPL